MRPGGTGARTPPVTVVPSGLAQRGKPSFGFPEGSSASLCPFLNLFRTAPDSNILEIFTFLSSRFRFHERPPKIRARDFQLERYHTQSVMCGLTGHSPAGCIHAAWPQEQGTWTHSNTYLRSWTKYTHSNTETHFVGNCPCVWPFCVQSLAST